MQNSKIRIPVFLCDATLQKFSEPMIFAEQCCMQIFEFTDNFCTVMQNFKIRTPEFLRDTIMQKSREPLLFSIAMLHSKIRSY